MDQVVITATSTTSFNKSSQSGRNFHYSSTVHPPVRSSCLDSEKSWLSNPHMDPLFLSTTATASSAAPTIPTQILPSSLIPATLFYPLQNIPLNPSVMLQRQPTTVSTVSNCTSKTLSGSGRS
ncbi:unnamed protein product, partial [Onchocerca flexuosa]|uniref:Ovule protein n=1 Tax=Onchocerca flexuosa TaxID=387005 RepID=A0A183I6L2_9BILA